MSEKQKSKRVGKVYLVGAGPGDPGLITVRGKYLLEKAEVVVYDYLASPKLLKHVPKDAELVITSYSIHYTKLYVKENSSLRSFMNSLPDILLGHDFPELVQRLAKAHRAGRPIIMGMGAHVIKVGLNPLLIDLMERSIITGLAMNGACIVHDAEIAMAGCTSEEVGDVLDDGAFGAAKETGEVLNAAISLGAKENMGMGQAVGEYLLTMDYPHNDKSLLATAARLGIRITSYNVCYTKLLRVQIKDSFGRC